MNPEKKPATLHPSAPPWQRRLGAEFKEKWLALRDIAALKKTDIWRQLEISTGLQQVTIRKICTGFSLYSGGAEEFFRIAGGAMDKLSLPRHRVRMGIPSFENYFAKRAKDAASALNRCQPRDENAGESDSHQIVATQCVVRMLEDTHRHGHSPFWRTHTKLAIELNQLFQRENRPIAFYYWRQYGSGLHWVDFYFLRVMKRMAMLEPPIHAHYAIEPIALITDESAASLEACLPVVKALLGGQGKLFSLEHTRNVYAADYDAFADLFLASEAYSTDGRDDTFHWLKFMPWYAHTKGVRNGYLQLIWDQRQSHYDLAHRCRYVKIVEIPSGTLELNGQRAKQEFRELLVEPQNGYASIVKWVASRPDVRCLEAFASYSMGIEEPNALQAVGGHSIWTRSTAVDRALANAMPQYVDDAFVCQVNRLAQVLRCWNKEHFSDLVNWEVE